MKEESRGVLDETANIDFVMEFYKNMLLIRRFEEKIAELYAEREMRCPVHLCIGHEAVAVGVCMNLDKEDAVFSNHRAHGHYIAKGGDINRMLAEMYGKAEGCSKGRGGSMHLTDLSANFIGSTPIVGGTIPLAAGSALASRFQNKNNVSVAFFGDSAVEEGVFSETVNFASLHKLNVLFVCENNLYSVLTHLRDRQPQREIFKIGEGHNILAYQIDGNDVLKVYETAKDAINHIKSGKGPALIECLTYRWLEHCGPNDDIDLGYRTEEEVMGWKRKDPIKRLREKLMNENKVSDKLLEKIELEILDKVNDAVRFSKNSPFPKKESLSEHVYAQ